MANPEHLEILKQGVEVWNRWRTEHPDIRPDLREANLRMMDLREGDLSQTNLRGANLWRTRLKGGNLVRANLGRVNLLEADLSRADLGGATLLEANLTRADLSLAELRGTNLTRADLFGTNLLSVKFHATNFTETSLLEATTGWATFTDVDLATVNGLETVRHRGPSSIGVDTLYKSEGKIPLVFLRGCGLPENLIEYLPSLAAPSAFEYFSCFISYNYQDRPFARRLHDQLQGRGIRCWLDEYQVLPGDDIRDSVDIAIRFWDKLLLCCSQNSLTSWWVDDEIEKGLQKEEKFSKRRAQKTRVIIPLNLDDYLFNADYESGHKSFLVRRHAADFSGWKKDNAKFEAEFEKVVRALRTDEGARPKAPASKL